ncbi:hypothetical protein F5878DRAFT_236103 [Lentinula raphanica]|uniref:Uncharacterized protein n=1 Tax=Lentinula raphanica TaxID=153919 RepID=A0AA38P6C7_9AGAR|nr:hypothetical protein F5878DRAFT_236103 [Lentinula raphanica]
MSLALDRQFLSSLMIGLLFMSAYVFALPTTDSRKATDVVKTLPMSEPHLTASFTLTGSEPSQEEKHLLGSSVVMMLKPILSGLKSRVQKEFAHGHSQYPHTMYVASRMPTGIKLGSANYRNPSPGEAQAQQGSYKLLVVVTGEFVMQESLFRASIVGKPIRNKYRWQITFDGSIVRDTLEHGKVTGVLTRNTRLYSSEPDLKLEYKNGQLQNKGMLGGLLNACRACFSGEQGEEPSSTS